MQIMKRTQSIQPKNKAVIYCRVSDPSQVQGTSLERQQEACLEYTRGKLGILPENVIVFVEKGESATAASRTEFLKVIEYCRVHQDEVRAFVVWKIDRFARNTIDHFAVKAQLTKCGVSLHSVTEPISDDPIGKMTETMLAGYAQFENEIRKQRCEGGMQGKIKNGIRPWKPPLGYICSKQRTDKRKTIPDQIDPERFYLVQKGLKEYAKGQLTIKRLTDFYNQWGLKTRTGLPMRKQLTERILTDKYYAGILTDPWTGEKHKGLHESMITLDEYDRIQYIKTRNSNVKNIPHLVLHPDFPLRRFVRCPCGEKMTGAWHTGRNNKKYPSYNCYNSRCEHYSRNIPKDELEGQFVRLLERFTPQERFLKLFREVVIDVWKGKHVALTQERTHYEGQVEKLKQQRERLTQMRMNGEITPEEFTNLKDSIDNQLTSFTISRNEAKTEEFDVEAAITYCERFIGDLARQWQDMSTAHKVELQSLVLPQGLVYDKTSGAFSAAVLSPIFALHREILETKKDSTSVESLLVAGGGFAPPTSWL